LLHQAASTYVLKRGPNGIFTVEVMIRGRNEYSSCT
jgi:hypothetical protein